jgi:hypothetical protein
LGHTEVFAEVDVHHLTSPIDGAFLEKANTLGFFGGEAFFYLGF